MCRKPQNGDSSATHMQRSTAKATKRSQQMLKQALAQSATNYIPPIGGSRGVNRTGQGTSIGKSQPVAEGAGINLTQHSADRATQLFQ